jgi:hypothetical protein
MKLFVVVLAVAVAASTQAMALKPLHQRHAKMTRRAEGDGGCGTNYHRGISGACVLNPTEGPYKPDPYWLYCDYSSYSIPRAVASSGGVVRDSSPFASQARRARGTRAPRSAWLPISPRPR